MLLKRLHIDTHFEYVVYMRRDCSVLRAEGFLTLNRILVHYRDETLIATLNVVSDGILGDGEAGLSESAWATLNAVEGEQITFSHPPQVESMQYVRSKMYGNKLAESEFKAIIGDIVKGRYSNIEVAAFITACSGDRIDLEEVVSLTRAMTGAGQQLKWNRAVVVDKHCIGGLPGNRTTPMVVAIAAEAGLLMPKTSSRAITSPAGTADTMDTITRVQMGPEQISAVVNKYNGCFAWGGSVNLSPADDILIRLERALDIDSEGQMIASVLSKKKAAGSTHVVIDIPVGKTAKVRTIEKAEKLKYYFNVVGAAVNIKVHVVITDGSQPVGRGIGPALEALDVLAVLRNDPDAPVDLKQRSLTIAGELLEFAGNCNAGEGLAVATRILESGAALRRFEDICRAQGKFTEPAVGQEVFTVKAPVNGRINEIQNRKLARVAKLAGAPTQPSAGLKLHVRLGDTVTPGSPLFTVYAEGKGELSYALDYLQSQNDIIIIG